MFRTPRLLAAALLLLVASAAQGDVIHLKDGTRIGGKVLSQNSRLVRVRTDSGKVETVLVKDIEKIEKGVDLPPEELQAERDREFMPGLDEKTRKAVRKEARRYEGPLRFKLNAAAREHVWVFGDMTQAELSRIAEVVERTMADFSEVIGVPKDAILAGDDIDGRYGPTDAPILYLFQFRQEGQYHRFIDKVLDRMRDETVSDERMRLMKRQKGFWIMTPRPLIARYQGPSTMQTEISNAAHLASHECLMLWRHAYTWMPWWFLEGFASWQEIRLTGHNLTYCIDIARPGEYAKEGTPEADESAKAKLEKKWRAKVKRMVKARDEKDLGRLALLSLNEVELPDVQQSWSFVDWLSRTQKLKRFALAYKMHRKIKETCEEVFDLPPQGVHEAWRKWVLKKY